MLEAPRDESANEEAAGSTHVPPDEPGDLFLTSVPLTADEHQAWDDPSFEDSREHPAGYQSCVVLGCSGTSGCDTPADQSDGEPFAYRKSLHDIDLTWVSLHAMDAGT